MVCPSHRCALPFLVRLLSLSVLAALAPAGIACGPSSPPPSTATVQLQASTPPSPEAVAARKTPEEALRSQEGRGCEAMTEPRDAAFCYLKSEAEASIEPLVALGRTLADKAVEHPVSYWPDFTYGAGVERWLGRSRRKHERTGCHSSGRRDRGKGRLPSEVHTHVHGAESAPGGQRTPAARMIATIFG